MSEKYHLWTLMILLLIVKLYFGLNGRIFTGSVVFQQKSGSASTGG
jgi:hypothetical protein